VSAPAEDLSNTTDQPGGKAVKSANISSKVKLENKATSKAEYTNTQQGLPVNGYNLAHLTRHARLLAGGVCFAKKQLGVSPYFQVLAIQVLVQLAILNEYLSLINHVGNN